ncbi:hypothetical protein CDAR_312541 [Caerostris darwini]|uniref:C2H2-type domain-containing protein n=1 Tax=Caerostris darwini TaxID=1538125 RepID=A0AAV4SZ46_9ARAC|nr:hypothetical protein CDAR_312541 [Caerostris darwini]
MDIRKCEFCIAPVTNSEVHYCRNFGNQHRQCVATLPRSSSGSIDQDIDLRTEQMHYEERIPSKNQTHSSWQHIISPNIHRKTGCEETAAAEVSSQYGVENQNPYNPEISDFLFPGMAHGKENQIESAYSLQPSDNNSAVMNQNHQFCEAWNLNHPVNAPVPVAEPCALPGFQETFGHRNALRNQLPQHPDVSSQMENSGTSRTDKMSFRFTSNFNESDSASTNQLSRNYVTSLGIPFLAVENAQFNPMDPIPPTVAISPIHSDKCSKEFLPKDNLEHRDHSPINARPYACNYCDKTFPTRFHLARHIRTHTGEKPHTCTVCNKCFAESYALTQHMRIHTGENSGPHKCTECGKCFAYPSKLHDHVRISHNHDRPYSCKECVKCFIYPSQLRAHVRSIHTGDGPFKCTECGKCFHARYQLKWHMVIHNKV